MLRTLLLILLAIVAIAVGTVCMQPADFKISRSLEINASADKVFELVNNLEKWEKWSPWQKMDPEMNKSFEGPKSGVGAKMTWSGDMNVGVGSMTILESTAGQSVKFQLDFEKPMKAINFSEFIFTSSNSKTMVTWTMTGKNDFLGKAMCLIFNCEKMIGKNFEDGLENLKQVSEVKKSRKR